MAKYKTCFHNADIVDIDAATGEAILRYNGNKYLESSLINGIEAGLIPCYKQTVSSTGRVKHYYLGDKLPNVKKVTKPKRTGVWDDDI